MPFALAQTSSAPPGRPHHRRSYTEDDSRRGAFAPLGSLPRRTPPGTPVMTSGPMNRTSKFHFPGPDEDEDSTSTDDNDDDNKYTPRVKLNPRSQLTKNMKIQLPTVTSAIPFPSESNPRSPASPKPLTPSAPELTPRGGKSLLRPQVLRTSSSPVIFLSNGKPLKSSLKSPGSFSSDSAGPSPSSSASSLLPPHVHTSLHVRTTSAPAPPSTGELHLTMPPPPSNSWSVNSSSESLPTTPTTPKNVHFASNLSSVKVFKRGARPAAVSLPDDDNDDEAGEVESESAMPGYTGLPKRRPKPNPSSTTTTSASPNGPRVGRRFASTTDVAFPFPSFLPPALPPPPSVSNNSSPFARYTLAPPPKSSVVPSPTVSPYTNVYLSSLSVVHTLPTDPAPSPAHRDGGRFDLRLEGTVSVRNLSFEKDVRVRFTLDEWATRSEVTARFRGVGGPPPILSTATQANPGTWDLFHFSINLSDYEAKLGERVLWLVIKYGINDGKDEWWDNNGGRDYRVGFVLGPGYASQATIAVDSPGPTKIGPFGSGSPMGGSPRVGSPVPSSLIGRERGASAPATTGSTSPHPPQSHAHLVGMAGRAPWIARLTEAGNSPTRTPLANTPTDRTPTASPPATASNGHVPATTTAITHLPGATAPTASKTRPAPGAQPATSLTRSPTSSFRLTLSNWARPSGTPPMGASPVVSPPIHGLPAVPPRTNELLPFSLSNTGLPVVSPPVNAVSPPLATNGSPRVPRTVAELVEQPQAREPVDLSPPAIGLGLHGAVLPVDSKGRTVDTLSQGDLPSKGADGGASSTKEAPVSTEENPYFAAATTSTPTSAPEQQRTANPDAPSTSFNSSTNTVTIPAVDMLAPTPLPSGMNGVSVHGVAGQGALPPSLGEPLEGSWISTSPPGLGPGASYGPRGSVAGTSYVPPGLDAGTSYVTGGSGMSTTDVSLASMNGRLQEGVSDDGTDFSEAAPIEGALGAVGENLADLVGGAMKMVVSSVTGARGAVDVEERPATVDGASASGSVPSASPQPTTSSQNGPPVEEQEFEEKVMLPTSAKPDVNAVDSVSAYHAFLRQWCFAKGEDAKEAASGKGT